MHQWRPKAVAPQKKINPSRVSGPDQTFCEMVKEFACTVAATRAALVYQQLLHTQSMPTLWFITHLASIPESYSQSASSVFLAGC